MKITIAAIGKNQSSSPTYKIIEEFNKRVPWKVNIKELEEKKSLSNNALKESEASKLLEGTKDAQIIVTLDESGKNLSSKEFASYISKWQNEGNNHIAFLIGGAAGHGKKTLNKANLILSLGKMTWPHMMARAMLCEQLYRSYTILNNHPYHK